MGYKILDRIQSLARAIAKAIGSRALDEEICSLG